MVVIVGLRLIFKTHDGPASCVKTFKTLVFSDQLTVMLCNEQLIMADISYMKSNASGHYRHTHASSEIEGLKQSKVQCHTLT